MNALLEQGRIVTWLDRNSEYADDLTPSKNCSTTPPCIHHQRQPLRDQLRIFAEDTKSRYAPFFKSSARVADLKKHLGALFVG